MTALDQAIIKAYLRQGGLPAPDEASSDEHVGPIYSPRETAHTTTPEPKRPRNFHRPIETVRPASVPFDALELTATALPSGIAEVLAGMSMGSDSSSPVAFETDSAPRATLEPPPIIAPTDLQDNVFEPMLRMDAISWPRPSRRLRLVANKQIERLADAVRKAAHDGNKIIGVAGFSHGEGCTTVLLAVALRLVELGQKTLLLDGDVAKPSLAEQLALDNETGWRDVALDSLPLEDVVTESETECVAILPYCGRKTPLDGPELSEHAICAFLKRLHTRYDVVLVDFGGTLTRSGSHAAIAEKLAARTDSILTVQNVRTTSPSDLAVLQQRLHRLGVQEAGVIENFADDGAS